jgi:hypothetical protein
MTHTDQSGEEDYLIKDGISEVSLGQSLTQLSNSQNLSNTRS